MGGRLVNGKDVLLQCRNCKQNFYFTAGEQAFYKNKGLNIPSLCNKCREQRKNKRAQQAVKQEQSRGKMIAIGGIVVNSNEVLGANLDLLDNYNYRIRIYLKNDKLAFTTREYDLYDAESELEDFVSKLNL